MKEMNYFLIFWEGKYEVVSRRKSHNEMKNLGHDVRGMWGLLAYAEIWRDYYNKEFGQKTLHQKLDEADPNKTQLAGIKVGKKFIMNNNTIQEKSSNKKKLVETIFLELLASIGMDTPSNFETILEFVYEDILETADDDFSYGDVVIAFRRWIENTHE